MFEAKPNGTASAPQAAGLAEGQPLHVVIVGAGIGGLTAAIALRQQGHDVTVLESSRFSNETGAAIHIAPNCNGLLRRMGLFTEKIGANTMNGYSQWLFTGKHLFGLDLREPNKMWEHPWHLVHRAHLHTALREMALSTEGKGKPATLKLASKVVSVDPEKGEVTLASGEKISGDVLLGADGVHSQTRKALVDGEKYKPFDGGQAAFRFLIPKEDLLKDPQTHEFLQNEGTLGMVVGRDRRIVFYPCVNNTLMNFLVIHPSHLSRSEDADWNLPGDKNKMMEMMDSFSPNVKAMLALAPTDTLKVWTLLDMEVLENWTNGKLALLGDAAHPFLPHQGQGGAQAIEDAVSLAAVLPLGTPKEDIPERLKLYQKCRQERANKIQEFTRMSGMSPEELAAKGQKLDPVQFSNYNFGHDEWYSSTAALNKHLWSKAPYRWRQPVSFGPAPGPRQPLGQLPDVLSMDEQHQEVASVRFKTSRTYLQTLFPNSQFSFTSPGTTAQASVIACTLKKMTWLGKTGYTHCGLYVHGVQYTKKDGTVLHGTFMPILFESLTDPIITGREELAAPKLGCEIDVETKGADRSVRMSWRGTTFMEMDLKNLGPAGDSAPAPKGPPKPTPDNGIFLYRYIPAVGEPGKADAEYAVFDEFAPGNPAGGAPEEEGEKKTEEEGNSKFDAKSAVRKEVPQEATLKFSPGTWDTLPTFHNVAKGLADVPIHEILEAKFEYVPTVGDVRGAKRIE